MKNLMTQRAMFVDSNLMEDIKNGKRKFSLKREVIKYLPLPAAALTASSAHLILKGNTTLGEVLFTLGIVSLAGAALEAQIVYSERKSKTEATRKALFEIQRLVDAIKTFGVETTLSQLLDSCILVTNISETEHFEAKNKTVIKNSSTEIIDFVFYDTTNKVQVLRQSTIGDKREIDLYQRSLDLLETTDPEYDQVVAKTRTRITAR